MPETTLRDWELGYSDPANTPENRKRIRKIADTLSREVTDLCSREWLSYYELMKLSFEEILFSEELDLVSRSRELRGLFLRILQAERFISGLDITEEIEEDVLENIRSEKVKNELFRMLAGIPAGEE